MKVLSLLQPWASLLVTPLAEKSSKAAKSWETRSWRPREEIRKLIQEDGMLIHASKKWNKDQRALLDEWPFKDYLGTDYEFPFSAIIGWVRVGDIIPTETWISRFSHFADGAAERYAEELRFGNYQPDRFAWEIKEFVKFDEPFTGVNGSLNLWECPKQLMQQIENNMTTKS